MQPNLVKVRVFDKVVDGTTTHAVIAFCQDEPIGSIDVTDWHKPGGWVTFVNVTEHFRRQGIARRMLERIIKDARKELKSGLGLSVKKENAAARALYESLGFRVCYTFGDDTLAMTLHL